MKSFDLKNHRKELRELMNEAPIGTKRIYVLDSTGEVDKILDFPEAEDVYKYFWAELHSVPVVIIIKLKKMKRVHIRVSEYEAVYNLKKAGFIQESFRTVTSVTKSGHYSRLQ